MLHKTKHKTVQAAFVSYCGDHMPMRFRKLVVSLLFTLGISTFSCERSAGYSVLTHELLIDLAWEPAIRPLLLARFPGSSAAQLREAHAYAYGGCAIQDLGYYPFGHRFFSNLTHYVRSGDFVESLFRNARTIDEYAFAIGVLSHYVGDNIGHEDAVNESTAINFPSLEKRYGRMVTYDQNPHGHVRTEFAFDIDQLSHHRLAPAAYLSFIGLNVPRRLLERAFFETYGLPLHEVLGDERAAIQSYRSSVRTILPRVAYGEAVLHRKGFPADVESDFLQFRHNLEQADFQNGWNAYRKAPGVKTHLIAFLIWITPKVGPASDLAIRGPNPQTEKLYLKSVNRASAAYEGILRTLAKTASGIPELPNRDLDTGSKVRPGTYALTDETYAKLLTNITKGGQRRVPEALRQDILEYYSDPEAPIATKKDAHAWNRVLKELPELKQMQAAISVEAPTEN